VREEDPAYNMTSPEDLSERLAGFLARAQGRPVRIEHLRLLTGGASRQTWSFDAVIDDATGARRPLPLVLRSDPRRGEVITGGIEYRLLETAAAAGVPVPKVYLMGDSSLGMPFYLMERVEGETIPRRLLRDDEYAQARRSMTAQLGATLAKIHTIDYTARGLDTLPAPEPGRSPAEYEIDRHERIYRAITPDPHPAFELAFRWLRAHAPPIDQRRLVHGDFRIGNVIFGPEGARAILDWELAHIGDPMEDLGWICVRSWRFGSDDLPAGGIGTRDELFRAYESAGGAPVDPARVRFWEAFGNLRWGITCIVQAGTYLHGASASVELASIGRRIAETEWELLKFMES
jgi:aminoglycoside phosphotransferase (APT) family kinase protein